MLVLVDDLIYCTIFYHFYLDSIYPRPLVYKGPRLYLEYPVNLQVVKTVCRFLLLDFSCNVSSSSLPITLITDVTLNATIPMARCDFPSSPCYSLVRGSG